MPGCSSGRLHSPAPRPAPPGCSRSQRTARGLPSKRMRGEGCLAVNVILRLHGPAATVLLEHVLPGGVVDEGKFQQGPENEGQAHTSTPFSLPTRTPRSIGFRVTDPNVDGFSVGDGWKVGVDPCQEGAGLGARAPMEVGKAVGKPEACVVMVRSVVTPRVTRAGTESLSSCNGAPQHRHSARRRRKGRRTQKETQETATSMKDGM